MQDIKNNSNCSITAFLCGGNESNRMSEYSQFLNEIPFYKPKEEFSDFENIEIIELLLSNKLHSNTQLVSKAIKHSLKIS